MNRTGKTFVLFVVVAALALVAALPWAPLSALTSNQLVGLATFAFLAVFSEALATNFAAGQGRQVASSISFIPVFACALVFPPILLILTVVIVAAATLAQSMD